MAPRTQDGVTDPDEGSHTQGSLVVQPEEPQSGEEDMLVEPPEERLATQNEFVQGSSNDRLNRPRAEQHETSSQPRSSPLLAQDAAPSQTTTARARRNLAKCTWEPCLPGQEVHAFVSALPLPRQSKYNVFNALCHCGVENAEDLDALARLIHDDGQAEQIITVRGVHIIEWLVFRHALQNHGSKQICPGPDTQFTSFLEGCTPPLLHLSGALHDMCQHTLQDLVELSTLQGPDWPRLQSHLISQGFTLSEWLSFRQRLRSLSSDSGSDSTLGARTNTSTVSSGSKVVEALKKVGLRLDEDIDKFCRLNMEHLDELLEMLSREGVSYADCQHVKVELQQRAREHSM
ncbi:hypothetical protein EIP91_012108 [Steccherinum ochraceum]|uniref:Uncharacterized protein n=1 Tax=Steccherinum ochraceum TaxID=92696 RepID=A0A4R0RQI9_9APHY|nr:hypothetical protein EIP91_012108 [Steccherinum ochraceum]